MAEQFPDDAPLQQIDSGKPLLPVWGPWQTLGLGFAIMAINAAAQIAVLVAFVVNGQQYDVAAP